ncbi:hypothetical protein PCI56_05530 [Plesiomonas shigelloides subsp. oncorhynchi]|nr:hypothetical protein [Plesiomonas shigelloides]MDA1379410.1 hypothetical protein [Plesiomonas shigelloides]
MVSDECGTDVHLYRARGGCILLSVFAAGFDWGEWVKLAVDTANSVASDPAQTLVMVLSYWGILSFFLLAVYSVMFKFKSNAASVLDLEKHSEAASQNQ